MPNGNWSVGDYLQLADAAIVIIPLVLLCMLIWLAARVGSFVAGFLSSDGGMSVREQRHRHRLENLACRMTLLCFAAGVFITVTGNDTGMVDVKDIKLPGGIEIGSAGAGIVLIGVGNSLLWMLLRFRKPQPQTEDNDTSAITAVAGQLPNKFHASGALRWLARLSYWQVGVSTLLSLPVLNIIALPAGILLAWQVAKSKKLVEQLADQHIPYVPARSSTSACVQ